MAGVRVRVTLVAVAVTAIALAVGGWGLVRSIERTQLGRVAQAAEAQVDTVAVQLEGGVPPDELAAVLRGRVAGATGYQVIQGGDVLAASPDLLSRDPLLVMAGTPGAMFGDPGQPTFIATGPQGSGTIEAPGLFDAAVALRVQYQTVQTPDGTLTIVAASPLDEVRRSIADVRRSLWVGLPLVTVLVGLVAWFVTGRALHPVEAMRAEVEAISHSTLHRRVPVPASNDEVGRLARTMNAMLDRLEGAAERQQRFVADASHELRSPVAALRTELEVALHTGETGDLRAAVEGALAEEARLEGLLADLLVLASVDEELSPPDEAVELGALVRAAAATPRRVPVVVDVAGDEDHLATGSARQLSRAVANLLDNAARHATSSVHVTIDGSRVVVDDDGPGIPAEERERVFERFTRLDEGRTRDAGGAGLGLSIVRAVVASHGGRVWAEESPQSGARFVVELPAR